MMKLMLAVVLLSIFSIDTSLAANWVQVGHTPDGSARLYMDTDSVQTDPPAGLFVSALEIYTVSVALTPLGTISLDGLSAAGQVFTEKDVYVVYNCQIPRRVETISVYYYRDGKLIGLDGDKADLLTFASELPGQRDYASMQFVCNKLGE